jgi:hypothetical protein
VYACHLLAKREEVPEVAGKERELQA